MAGDSGTEVVTFPFVNATEVMTLATIMPLLCISVVGMRLYTRVSKGYKLGLDDFLMLPGVLLYVGVCICMLIGASNNVMGRGSGTRTNPELQTYLVPQSKLFAKLFFAFQIMVVIGFGFIKCSILALYRRIFVSAKDQPFDIVCKVMTAIVIGWSVTFLVLVCLSCGPSPWAYWGTLEQKSTCATFTGTRGLAGTDMVIDVLLMLLPQPLIWTLGLTTRKTIAISVLIALGCTCIGADIAQTVLFSQIQKASDLGIPLDQNEMITLVMYYTCIDGGLAVTAACLVTLRPLFRSGSTESVVKHFKKPFSTFASSEQAGRDSKMWQFEPGTPNSTGGTESSGGTLVDVEKGPLSPDVREVRTPGRISESLALATAGEGANNVQPFDYFVREFRAPLARDRSSGLIALAAGPPCNHCGR